MTLGLIHEITGRCNLACAFCYNPWRESGPMPAERLPQENADLLIRVLADSGARWLTFAGGEPLLYDGLEEVVHRIHRRFPSVTLGLATNGLLLPPRLEGLVRAGITQIEVSVFTSRTPTYRDLAGTGQVETPLRALAQARALGLATTVGTVLRKGMAGELEEVIRLARTLGADRVALNRFAPRGRGKVHAADFDPDSDCLDALLQVADRVAAELGMPVLVTTPIEDCRWPHDRYPHLQFGACTCGETKWVIDPEGCLRICELSETRLGNLWVSSFSTLRHHPEVARFRNAHRKPTCAPCPSWSECQGGCRFTPGTNRQVAANSEHGGGRE